MKIARLTSSLPDRLRLLPKPRLRQGKRHAYFSPKSDPTSVYSPVPLLLALLPPLLSLSPRESASVFTDYLKFHFSVSQPKAVHSRARGYLSKLRQAMSPEVSHLSFCSPSSPIEFLTVATNLSSSTVSGPDKVAFFMLKHLPRSGMNFLLYMFNLSWSLHYFPSIRKTFSIISIHKVGKPLDSPAFLRPPASQSFLNASFYCVYSSFCSLPPFSLSATLISALDSLFLVKLCFFLGLFQMGSTNPSQALGNPCYDRLLQGF